MAEENVTEATDNTAEEASIEEVAEGSYEPEVSEEAGEEVHEAVAEETQEVEAQPQEVHEEPDDNAERSRLGRKVKYIEDSVNNMNQQLLERMEQLQNMMYYRSNPNNPADISYGQEEEDTGIYTRDDIRREFERIEREKQRSTMAYNNAYTQAVSKLSSDLSDDEFSEIDKEFRANFNFRHSNDPVADAERNWYKAERAVLRKKMATPKKTIPLKNEKPIAPLGGSSATKTSEKKRPAVKLDAAAQEFIRRTGMSEEKAMEILSR